MIDTVETRRRFMAHFAGVGLGTTLVPGVLWARMQDAGASQVTLEMVTDALKLSGIDLSEEDRKQGQPFAQGEELSLEEAVAYVRRARGSRKRPSGGWESLTPTELETARHAAAGLTNAEIGERMFIARGTVKIHLSHIYAKLNIQNRSFRLQAFRTFRTTSTLFTSKNQKYPVSGVRRTPRP